MNFLENNPFYLLDVMPTDTRATIVAKAEEKSFRLGDDVCSEAQASLLNPSKRLSAEIDWFCDCDRAAISSIRSCIRNKVRIKIGNLSGLSNLNAMLFNFVISDFYRTKANIDTIDDIDKQYSAIDEVSTAGEINACRSKAGLLSVSCDEVGRELKKKREQIKHIISDKILSMEEDDYVHLVGLLSRDYYDYKAGVIIDDIVDQYELKMQTSIETASNGITSAIARIKRIANKEGIEANLTGLVRKVHDWDELVKPVQQKAAASGVEYQMSKDIGVKIRNFAMWLHEERDLTEQALMLIDLVNPVFDLIDSLYCALLDDKALLRNMLNQSNEISDKVWERLEPILPDGNAQDNRTFINAVLWIMSTEADWCYLPPYFGDWCSFSERFDEWREKGVWEKVLEVLIKYPDYEWLFIDAGRTLGGSDDMGRTETRYVMPWMRMVCRSYLLLWKIEVLRDRRLRFNR